MKIIQLLTILLMAITTMNATSQIYKKVLDNGLTILVLPRHETPEVMVSIHVGVGSKDEKSNEKGIAHLIEHMMFKGTETYSEGDVSDITYKLSAGCNAATSYDWTHYWFNLPSAHWHTILPIMADLMASPAFKDEHLDSEFKVVIQELKMRRDSYDTAMFEELFKIICSPHPYGHPIIGYKQDLWNLHGSDLKAFYKKHYHPNNAVLVIVGDVQLDDVFAQSQQLFSSLQHQPNYTREQFHFPQDIAQKTITLHRAVANPVVKHMYCLPGSTQVDTDIYSLLGNILGLTTHTRISKRLLDDEQLVTACAGGATTLFDQSFFIIRYQPKNIEDKQKIDAIIQQEIDAVIASGIPDHEIERAIKYNRSMHFDALQSNRALALAVGKTFLEGNDPETVLKYFENPDVPTIRQELLYILQQYLKPTVRHTGIILPLQKKDSQHWLALQQASDMQDKAILDERIRTSDIESAKNSHNLNIEPPQAFNFAQPTTFMLDNGLKVLYHTKTDIPKIELILKLKVTGYNDPVGKDGLASFVNAMLIEGTQNFTKEQLIEELESNAIGLSVTGDIIHVDCLKQDLEKALNILHEVLVNATFPETALEKIRQIKHHGLDQFWDTPGSIAYHLAYKHIYKNQRFGTHEATHETIDAITRQDLIEFYTQYYSPVDARLAIVGDIKQYEIQSLVKKTLGSWQGKKIEDIEIKDVVPCQSTTITHAMDRDQVVLFLVGNSITRDHADFDKILLFDQIFGPGMLHSMNNRLFMLREQTGIFYTPQGSLLNNCSTFKGLPGLIMFGSLISKDNVTSAETMLKQLADTVVDSITQEELDQAKRTIGFATVANYSTNASIAQIFLYLDRLGLPFDYLNNRSKDFEKITLDEVKTAVKNILHSSKLSVIKVGRI